MAEVFTNAKKSNVVFLALLSLTLIVLINSIYPQDENETYVSGIISRWSIESGSVLESVLIKWPIVSIIIIVIMLVIISAAYMISKSFNLPNLKAWADTELGQLMASAVIVAILLGALIFMNSASELIVTEAFGDLSFSDGPDAPPKHVQIADYYLDACIESVENSAMDLLRENVAIGEIASQRRGRNLQTLPYIASSENENAYKRLDMTRNDVIFMHYGRIISSLKVQEIFINGIGLFIGPFFLLTGIILRTFFMTRRAGGMFISIGIGLLFIYPLAYSLSLYTLKMIIYGNNIAPPAQECPEECLIQYPIGYNASNTSQLFDTTDIAGFLPPGSSYFDYDMSDPIWDTLESEHSIVLCDRACEGCALACRELPPINGLCDCNETACAECPRTCKISRIRGDCINTLSNFYCPESRCPNYCRLNYTQMIENLELNDCGDCPINCRVRYLHLNSSSPTGFTIDPEPPEFCEIYADDAYEDCKNCTAYAIVLDPEETLCETVCEGCPENCRIMDENGWVLPDGCPVVCNDCPTSCKAVVPTADDDHGCGNCSGLDIRCRFVDTAIIDQSCLSANYMDCPIECMADSLPTGICNGCFDCERDCTNIPPIRTDCADVCGFVEGYMTSSSPKQLLKSLSTKLGAPGAMQDTKNVGIAYVPAYILPLICIVLTLSFIRGMSRVLGGEIEIPGLTKLL